MWLDFFFFFYFRLTAYTFCCWLMDSEIEEDQWPVGALRLAAAAAAAALFKLAM